MTAALRATGLCRRFGGLVAVADVSLDLHRGQAHAVIGPNGAGKSTLINLLSGALTPDEGSIVLNGTDMTGLPDWRRARSGLGRSFQRTQLFPTLTVLENTRLAAQSRTRGWHLLRRANDDPDTTTRGTAALDQVGLSVSKNLLAGTLSHGERRLLEIALVLATGPDILLLDEPLAGLGAEETAPVVALLQTLAARYAMLLVEHDMDAVFAVARQVTVMVDGRVLESGTPDDIRRSPAVRDAYLGHRE
jgi:branched-chain amino acid transport system ATP-binding protein